MNVYAAIVITTLCASYALGLAEKTLSLRAMRDQIPSEFESYCDAAEYQKAQRYTRARTRFSRVRSTFDLGVLFAFWGGGGFEKLNAWLNAALAGQPELVIGLAYFTALVLGQSLVSLPFSVYSTFVLEERFGLNKTTPLTFVGDLFKGLLLAALLGLPAAAALLSFFAWGGQWAWLAAWGFVAAFMIAVQYVVPTWIMPLFNKFTPLPAGELRDGLLKLADRVAFPLDEVMVIDGSRRSSKANAFFTGFGKHKRIALFDTLINTQTPSELTAVLAHEIGHYKRGHILKGMVLGVLQIGATLFLLGVFVDHRGLYEAFGVSGTPLHVGFVLFSLLMAPIDLVTSLLVNARSRKHEFEADRFAVENTDDGEALVSGLKKLSVNHLANLTPHPLSVFLNYSHPPVLERIHAIRAAAGAYAAVR